MASDSDMPSSLRDRLDLDREFDIFLGGAFGSSAKKPYNQTVDFSGEQVSRNLNFGTVAGC